MPVTRSLVSMLAFALSACASQPSVSPPVTQSPPPPPPESTASSPVAGSTYAEAITPGEVAALQDELDKLAEGSSAVKGSTRRGDFDVIAYAADRANARLTALQLHDERFVQCRDIARGWWTDVERASRSKDTDGLNAVSSRAPEVLDECERRCGMRGEDRPTPRVPVDVAALTATTNAIQEDASACVSRRVPGDFTTHRLRVFVMLLPDGTLERVEGRPDGASETVTACAVEAAKRASYPKVDGRAPLLLNLVVRGVAATDPR